MCVEKRTKGLVVRVWEEREKIKEREEVRELTMRKTKDAKEYIVSRARRI